jgi:hypothetical protein
MNVSKMEIVGIAVGSFAVATLANIAANKLTEENVEEKKKAIYFVLAGVALSFALMTIFDMKKI